MSPHHIRPNRLGAILEVLRCGLNQDTVVDWLGTGGPPATALAACAISRPDVLPDRLFRVVTLPDTLNVIEVRFLAGQLAISFERAGEGAARDRLALANEDLLAVPADLPCGEIVASHLNELLAPIRVVQHPQLRRRWAPAPPPAGLVPEAVKADLPSGHAQLLCALVLADRSVQEIQRAEEAASEW